MWFFKKKSEKFNLLPLSSPQKQVLAMSAKILDLTLMMCRSVDRYEEKLKSPSVKGHLAGFFRSSLAQAGCPPKNDDQLFNAMIFSIALLLGKDLKSDAIADYVVDLMSFMVDGITNNEFNSCEKAGWEEYVAFYKGTTKSPMKIGYYFHTRT